MNFGESVLFTSIMTLMDEVRNNKNIGTQSLLQSSDNRTDIKFTFENLKAKDKLISLAEQLFDKANDVTNAFVEIDVSLMVSSLIVGCIYESVKSISADYEVKSRIFDYSMKYCNVQTEFTWDALQSNEEELEDILKQLYEMTLNLVFVASSISGENDISTDIVRAFTELMIYTEESIIYRFPSTFFTQRPPLVALEMIMAAMEKELHRLEEEDPSLKEEVELPKDNERISSLRADAREALNLKEMQRAAAFYNEISNIAPDDWEAIFYKEFCSVFSLPEAVSTIKIHDNTEKIAQAIAQAMPKAKRQILIRPQLLAELTNVCSCLCDLATNYFVATMNEAKKHPNNETAKTRKINQVYWIMKMMFLCGDAIEQTFKDDFDLCKNLCYVCWKIAFDCYENCNMGAPSEVNEYYQKILKYEPSFRCSKPLVNPTNSSGGCYVATAVYGSYDCPQVWTLRRYRDYSLAKSRFGRSFIRFYYATSPTLVNLFGHTKWFNSLLRKPLDRFTKHLISKGFQNTPYVDGIENKVIK